MKFPDYSGKDYAKPPTSVVQGYVRFFGDFERDNRDKIAGMAKTNIQQIAMRIGRGCLIADDGNDRAADRVFRRAQRDLEPTLETPKKRRSWAGRRAAELLTTARMLEYRHDSKTTAELRQEMHLSTTRNIERLHAQLMRTGEHALMGGQRGAARGELIERVGLGMLTRYSAHPWVMGTPALVHHDVGDLRRNNFDLLLVESSVTTDHTAAHRVQAKAECLGMCANPQPKYRRIKRDEYSPDIVFLSGCCDLGFSGAADDTTQYRMAELLVREAQDDVGPAEIEELDLATGSLLLSLTGDLPSRMGTYGQPAAA